MNNRVLPRGHNHFSIYFLCGRSWFQRDCLRTDSLKRKISKTCLWIFPSDQQGRPRCSVIKIPHFQHTGCHFYGISLAFVTKILHVAHGHQKKKKTFFLLICRVTGRKQEGWQEGSEKAVDNTDYGRNTSIQNLDAYPPSTTGFRV